MDHRALFIWSCALLQILFLAVDAAAAPSGKGAKYLCECYLRQLKKSTDLTWTPGRNFHENTTDGDMRKLYGYSKNLMNARTVGKKDSEPAKIFGKKTEDKLYPENFDSRDHWPACNSTISTIFDTGFCASHWAASVVQAISDRICIHSGGKKKNLKLSPLHPLQCCKTCGSGCKGGYPFQAWKFIEKSGIVTGGDYGSSDGCKPYPIKSPCDYSTYPNSCILKKNPVLTCPNPDKHCSTKETKPHIYNIDLVRTIPNSDQFTQAWTADFIKQEIISNGPVTATMRLFSDFFSYKKGIYSPTKDARKLDDVTMKIIGWGRDRQKKIDYWLGVMPWGNKFGDGGFVKIRQGVSQLQIDRRMHAGVPQLH